MKLFGAMKVKNNELLVGGVSCSHLVREFGSPLCWKGFFDKSNV